MSRFPFFGGRAIIGSLLLLSAFVLGGCSSIRLAYGNASQLAWWWIDGYVDFSREQAPQIKDGLDRFAEWHRRTQLPEWLPLLVAAQAQITEPLTPELACRWQAQAREKFEPTLQRALSLAADALPGLGEEQFRHLEQRYAKRNDEMKRDFLDDDPKERLDAAVKRTLARVEQVYGRLGDDQKRVVREGVVASPFDPALWLAERKLRQADVLQTMRRLAAEKADSPQRLAALRGLVERSERSPQPGYAAYQARLATYNCAFVARIHNATTPAQRLQARENLKGWEDDLRSFLPPPG